MKTLKTIVSIILATASITSVVTSCQRENEYGPRSGKSIVFSTWTPGSAATSKAVYTGIQQTVGDKKYEGINWEAGDVISIASPQTAEKCEEYRIETGGGNESAAEPVNQGLKWGSGPHTFYGMYPGLSKVSGSNLTDEGVLTGVISATQTPKYNETESKYIISASDGSYTVPADLKNGYMYTKVTGVEAYSEDVELPFIPFTTAIRFTITNDYEHDGSLNIRSISVISESGKKLSGTFTATLTSMDASGYPTCTTATGDKDRVTMDFTSTTEAGYIALAKGKTLEFTLFFNPGAGDLDDLYFRVNKGTDSVDEGWIQTKLAYKDMTGIAFPCHKKSYVTGILVPEGAIWTVRFDPNVDPWGDGGTSSENPDPEAGYEPVVMPWTTGGEQDRSMVKYNYSLKIDGALEFGHEGTAESSITISSQRELNHVNTPVVWHLEYWSGTAWTPAKTGVPIDGFLTLNPTIGSGAGEDIELPGIAEIKMKVEGVTSAETTTASHNGRLQGAAVKGAENAPYDLCMHDIYGNARTAGKPVCANSYVINAPGWYAFPLAYGNSIDSDAAPAGGVNVPAYDPGAEADPTVTFLSQFPNANGNRILEPYIDSDPAAGQTGWSAEVLWQDAAGINVSSCYVIDASTASDRNLKACPCHYAVFHLESTGLTQGNFVLAVKNGSQLMWSWHIWVTDNVLKAVPVSATSPKEMLPLNLGWVDSDVTTAFNSYAGKSVKLKAVQSGSNATLEFEVVRRAEDDATHTSGHSLYWQWGRKDPFTGSPVTGAWSSASSIAWSIQHPTTFVCNGSGKYQWYYEAQKTSGTNPTIAEAAYRNLWSATNKGLGESSTGYNTKPIKTIYDPCPPGFQVPQADAFSSLGTGVLPAQGGLSYQSGALTGTGSGYYWNAVPKDGISSYFTGRSTGYNQSAYRANGYSVRPVKQ